MSTVLKAIISGRVKVLKSCVSLEEAKEMSIKGDLAENLVKAVCGYILRFRKEVNINENKRVYFKLTVDLLTEMN